MDFYSVTLALGLGAAVAALGLAAYCWLGSAGVFRSAAQGRARRFAWRAAVAALGLVFVSTASHLVNGHRPGSSSELALAAFVREHPALVITSLLALGAFLLLWIARPAAGNVAAPRRGA